MKGESETYIWIMDHSLLLEQGLGCGPWRLVNQRWNGGDEAKLVNR